jgi:hypothetical protein
MSESQAAQEHREFKANLGQKANKAQPAHRESKALLDLPPRCLIMPLPPTPLRKCVKHQYDSLLNLNFMKLFIEMEDVLCDVSTAVADILGLPVKFDTTGRLLGCTNAQKDDALSAQPASFWQNLNPMPEFNDIRTALLDSGLDIQVLTSGYSVFSESGKQAWLSNHFPESKLTLIRNKYALAASDTVLIDSHPGALQTFKRDGGHTILIPQPWQKNFKPQQDIKQYLTDRIAAVIP